MIMIIVTMIIMVIKLNMNIVSTGPGAFGSISLQLLMTRPTTLMMMMMMMMMMMAMMMMMMSEMIRGQCALVSTGVAANITFSCLLLAPCHAIFKLSSSSLPSSSS